MSVTVFRVEDGSWLSNAYLVTDAPGGHGLVIDTGAPVEPLIAEAKRLGVRVPWILSTHFHHDHIAGNGALARAFGAEVGAHRLDKGRIPGATRALEDGDVIEVGALSVRVLHIPGHTAGQAAFLVGDTDVFTGDTLFRRSVGGCVGPGASGFADLRRSLVERLLALPDAVAVHPGHTLPSTIGEERRENPFLRVMLGVDPPGRGRCRALGRAATLIVLAEDYDGGTKAWVRFEDDGSEATVPGSRVEVE
jgi:hydroxyacylglutathione hydrolase